jgi:hypothetical protein
VQSKSGGDTAVDVTLFGGLGDEEWEEWKKVKDINKWTDEQVERLEELSGRIPLYIYECMKVEESDVVNKLDAFEESMGNKAYDHLYTFSKKSVPAVDADAYLELMSAAVGGTPCEIVPGLFDQRYFFPSKKRLVPVSNLVQRIMAEILVQTAQDAYFKLLTPDWIHKAMQCDNPITRGFAYEQYALASLYRNPAALTGGKIKNIDSIEFFSGEAPATLKDSQTILYWPKRFNLPHMDGVVRSRTTSKLVRLDIQVTCQSISRHASSLDFYTKKDGSYLKWLRDDEIVWLRNKKKLEQVLCWIVPEPFKGTLPVSTTTAVKFEQTVQVLKTL